MYVLKCFQNFFIPFLLVTPFGDIISHCIGNFSNICSNSARATIKLHKSFILILVLSLFASFDIRDNRHSQSYIYSTNKISMDLSDYILTCTFSIFLHLEMPMNFESYSWSCESPFYYVFLETKREYNISPPRSIMNASQGQTASIRI